MGDDRMFSQLMTDSRRVPMPPPNETKSSKQKVLHLSVNLPENQAEIVARYFALLYPTDRRATRSAIVGVALEILDRILHGSAPDALDSSLLDAYARTSADSRAGAQMRRHSREP